MQPVLQPIYKHRIRTQQVVHTPVISLKLNTILTVKRILCSREHDLTERKGDRHSGKSSQPLSRTLGPVYTKLAHIVVIMTATNSTMFLDGLTLRFMRLFVGVELCDNIDRFIGVVFVSSRYCMIQSDQEIDNEYSYCHRLQSRST